MAAVKNWYPKKSGFESATAGNSSWGSTSGKNVIKDFEQWRLGLLLDLERSGIPYSELPDRTIVANFPQVGYHEMTLEMQKLNHSNYKKKMTRRATNA